MKDAMDGFYCDADEIQGFFPFGFAQGQNDDMNKSE
jgi:hypothetical protein